MGLANRASADRLVLRPGQLLPRRRDEESSRAGVSAFARRLSLGRVAAAEQRTRITPKADPSRTGRGSGSGTPARLSFSPRPEPSQPAVIFPTTTFAIFFCIVLVANWLLMPHPRLAAVHHRRELRLLRRLELAVRLPARGLDRLEPGHGRADPPRRRSRAPEGAPLARGRRATSGVLGYFKYYDFFVSSTDNLATSVGLGIPLDIRSIVLPVGISFFTFQAISYVVDIYRGELEPATLDRVRRLPVVLPAPRRGADRARPASCCRSSTRPRDPRRVDTSRAFYLIATGLFKKVVIANYLATHIVDPVFARARASTRRSRSWSRVYALRRPDLLRLLAATPTSRSASRCCSASGSRRTSTRRTGASRSRTSGGAGT